jgi:hypothetical protein
MSVSILGFSLVANDFIRRGEIGWLDRRGGIIAMTTIYDADDPTDKCEQITVPPGMTAFVTGAMVSPQDFDAVSAFIQQSVV